MLFKRQFQFTVVFLRILLTAEWCIWIKLLLQAVSIKFIRDPNCVWVSVHRGRIQVFSGGGGTLCSILHSALPLPSTFSHEKPAKKIRGRFGASLDPPLLLYTAVLSFPIQFVVCQRLSSCKHVSCVSFVQLFWRSSLFWSVDYEYSDDLCTVCSRHFSILYNFYWNVLIFGESLKLVIPVLWFFHSSSIYIKV